MFRTFEGDKGERKQKQTNNKKKNEVQDAKEKTKINMGNKPILKTRQKKKARELNYLFVVPEPLILRVWRWRSPAGLVPRGLVTSMF